MTGNCRNGRKGRSSFWGPSATSGYFRNPEETRPVSWPLAGFRRWAYIADGELFITGRSKDIIIKAGRNIYPEDLEEAIGKIAGIRKGNVVVFGSTDPVSGTERLVAVAETRETDAGKLA